jgi:hypothetical protein
MKNHSINGARERFIVQGIEELKIIKKELGESPLQCRDRKDDDKK